MRFVCWEGLYAHPEYKRGAEVGMFDARSWTYWHYRSHLAAPGEVPPLPSRGIV